MDSLEQLLASAPRANGFFSEFEERFIRTEYGEIFCRIGGKGAPVLLLHGYPQTSAMWHRVAPELAESYTVICADLRGYGRSFKPVSDKAHLPYSKRAMAADMAKVMTALGHDTFYVGAHDRGARVAHRLGLDYPDRVRALVTLDIAPTREMYRDGGGAFAQTYWHWYWLTQPAPFPETLIGNDPDFFWLKKCGSGSAGLSPFVWEALNEYLTCFRDPSVIHGSCEDYRAALTIDIAHDNADDGQKLQMPVRALWGEKGAIEKHFDCLASWRERALRVTGRSLPGGHYLAEEMPGEVVAEFETHFSQAGQATPLTVAV